MSLATLAGALAQLAVLLILGWIVADVALRRGHVSKVAATGLPDGIGLPERALLAIVGFVALCVALMVAHMITGGAVFGTSPAVPLVGVAVLGFGMRRFRLPRGVPWLKLLAFAAVLIAIYETPVLLEGSGVRAGDSSWHMGWTEQLLDGEPTPPGPAPEFGRNAYPWGFHAVMATMVRLIPGSDALMAQEALQLLLLIGLPLAAACLARRLRTGSGWAGAVCASLIGGFGWIAARQWSFDASPTEARFGADLVAASPNSVYELMIPAFPREVGLVMLGAAGLLIVLAIRTEDRRFALPAGVTSGLVGLVSVPLFVHAVLWLVVGALFAGRGARRTVLVPMAIPAALTFALWAGPVVANYVRFDGFVNITSTLGREWPIPVALWAWGLLLPLAAVGVVLAARARTSGVRVLMGFATTTVVLLIAARVRGALDWELANNATLLHQGRVWPVAHLLGAAFAGSALTAGYMLLRRRGAVPAVTVAALIVAVGVVSPVLAAGGITRILAEHRKGYVYGSGDFAPGSFVMEASEVLDSHDIVQPPRNDESNVVGFWLFQFSGSRVTGHVDARYEGNELRIRYEELANDYSEVVNNGGFEPDYIARPESVLGSGAGGRVVVRGPFMGQTWVLVRV
ncbi:MAG: hypothetical protein ACRDKZ_14970 [Actinomycetota bacterium]